MIHIHQKTLQDLELPTLLSQISDYCKTELGQERVLEITPYASKTKVLNALHKVHEYISSFDNDNSIPSHSFQEINDELKLLTIEDSILELSSFRKIAVVADTAIDLIHFFKKFDTYYPTLNKQASEYEVAKEIASSIRNVIDRFGEVKDKASDTLYSIRKSMNRVRGQLNSSFVSALQMYSSSDYLDDIRETVVENKRVLAVKAMHRRKVKGAILGASKTGSIVYIEPETTLQLHRELNNLEYEEKEEINKILRALTNHIRIYHPLLVAYQNFLTDIDVIAAKALYSQAINGVLPNITEERFMYLRDAFHPLLFLANKVEGKVTYPQTIELSKDNRIIVISGPNAGGKSITLKTVGLLQVMLQCGVLVPVHERSTMCIFNRVLSDIGDNQSIENHLSTYSYRLKQMNYFLKKCNDKTLFLIDEFGTGSDPELGGALAETFLEVFYERESFGIITTHYTNLKLLANELPHMQNANMLFDERSLEPIYKLVLGQAGSSFTFEVAQKNGIPYSLINKAKKKIERGKVRFDKTIAKLQKERSKLEKTERSLKVNEQKKIAEADRLEEINNKVQKKLESYQELFDANQRLVYLGQKIDTIAERYHNNKKKRDLMNEFFKIIQIENSKRKKIAPKQQKAIKVKAQQVKKEVEKKVAVIREKKKEEKQKAALQPPKPKAILKVGDRVRLEDGRAVGTIDKIEKSKAVVNYGLFTTNVSVEQLELVEAAKK
jgi:DNA mismatch repair protein MutS2